MNQRLLIFLSFFFVAAVSVKAQPAHNIVINELMVKNETGLPDDHGEVESWVEIYNPGSDSVNIGGMYFTDNLNNPNLWQIPKTDPRATSVPPDTFLTLWLDGQPDQGVRHVNFKLNKKGGELGFFDESNNLLDKVSFESQYADIPYGRLEEDESRFEFLAGPTPGRPNIGKMKLFDWVLYRTTRTDKLMWGLPMIALLLCTGLFLTLATKGLQFSQFWPSLKLIFSKEARSEVGKGDISPFAALMTALAATVGNGNIAGVATAIAIGGPGAPVFMWIAGLFGMATKYAEGFLGVQYREIAPNGTMAGGPMYYAKNGLKNKKLGRFLGGAFALFGTVACLIGTGNMAQSNSMTESMANMLNRIIHGGTAGEQAPGIYYVIIGLVIALLVGLVIIGGIKKIGRVAERLVPGMIVFYIFFALWIIISKFTQIPAAFAIIFKSAFGFQPLLGATVGYAIQNGVSRGLLSNEAGLGSAAIAQSASSSEEPTNNGLIAMTGVFIDTILVNTMTTLTIVLTGAYQYTQAWRGLGRTDNITGIEVTQTAFHSAIPFDAGAAIIAFASFLFGYTTLLGWSYYGEKCIEYLGGDKVVRPFRYTFIVFLFIGAILTAVAGENRNYLNIVWNLGNIGNALMAGPNLIGLLFLTGVVARITKQRLEMKEQSAEVTD
ncbi:amino acid carrier protein [candidate division KSB1 bacterium]|nr:amino acid carrier protein [candidate division KSB1 bacterium]NIR69538.1 amino acid carrier protein [candidate division KSB1 bacterium]NIS22848.1 amino acid carrier protein [candidate division KSB1 bacterium]NIT69684.1 amino acid carrier protein [candidate division KSB1 bacterium]NIU23354.1 amino acid carrier protein [candidate division KSB1 bacterium]